MVCLFFFFNCVTLNVLDMLASSSRYNVEGGKLKIIIFTGHKEYSYTSSMFVGVHLPGLLGYGM